MKPIVTSNPQYEGKASLNVICLLVGGFIGYCGHNWDSWKIYQGKIRKSGGMKECKNG